MFLTDHGEVPRCGPWTEFESLLLLEAAVDTENVLFNLSDVSSDQVQRLTVLFNDAVQMAKQLGIRCNNKDAHKIRFKLEHFKTKQKLRLLLLEEQISLYLTAKN